MEQTAGTEAGEGPGGKEGSRAGTLELGIVAGGPCFSPASRAKEGKGIGGRRDSTWDGMWDGPAGMSAGHVKLGRGPKPRGESGDGQPRGHFA